MGFLQKKLLIIIGLACGILAYSFYGFIEKSAVSQSVVPGVSPAGNTPAVVQNGIENEIVIYISGGVNKPGVYKLPRGSRVVDAVNLAGGFVPGADAARINLAMLVKDEMQVNVPYMPIIAAAATNGAPVGTSINGSNNEQTNINTASKAELDKLPGIGPALAERIIEYRAANGLFREIADLKKVPGIGEAKFNQFKDKITL